MMTARDLIWGSCLVLIGCGGGMQRSDGGGPDTGQPDLGAPTVLSGVVAITGGTDFTCALVMDGSVYCWGGNYEGQLGRGHTNGEGLGSQAASRVAGLAKAVSIASGSDHTCAAVEDGTVWCWGGNNTEGQLGRADPTPNGAPTPVKVEGPSGVTRVFAGFHTTCAVTVGAPVSCWGNAISAAASSTPMPSGLLDTAKGITPAGSGYGYVVLSDGSLACWADRSNDCGPYTNPTAYARVPEPVKQVMVGAGSCALLATGTVQCWGHNLSGGLGNGSIAGVQTDNDPVAPVGLGSAVAIGGSGIMCAITADADVKCWGGIIAMYRNVLPTTVEGLHGATAVWSGTTHVCAVMADTTARCWGLPGFRGDRASSSPAGPGGPVLKL